MRARVCPWGGFSVARRASGRKKLGVAIRRSDPNLGAIRVGANLAGIPMHGRRDAIAAFYRGWINGKRRA